MADTSYLSRKGFESLLHENTDFESVGEVQTIVDLTDQLRLYRPNILVVDYHSIEFKIENIRHIVKTSVHTKVLAITPALPKELMSKALDSTVTSHLLKDCDKEEIIEALYKTAKGEKFICGKILDILVAEPKESITTAYAASCDGVNVTDREMEIISLVAEGYSNKQIADKLFLSTHTVTTHRKNIMGKLKVNNTAGLVLYAVRNNLLGPNKYLFSSEN